MLNQIKIASVLLLLVLSTHSFSENKTEQQIVLPVDDLHENLLYVMRNTAADPKTRYQLMSDVVTRSFEIPIIAKIVLGRYWSSLDEKQQNEFIDLFHHLTVLTYLNRFDAFDEENFQTISLKSLKKDRYLIKTKLLTKDNTISLNYILQNIEGAWKIIGIIANGINDLSLKRAEYTAVINTRGYGALVAEIEKKINTLKNKLKLD